MPRLDSEVKTHGAEEGDAMNSKMNHFVCPRCGHDFYDDAAYSTCDACQTFFYVSQSRTCQLHNDGDTMIHNSIAESAIPGVWPR